MKWTKDDLQMIKVCKKQALDKCLWIEAYEWQALQLEVEKSTAFQNDDRYFTQGYVKWTQLETKLGYIVYGHN